MDYSKCGVAELRKSLVEINEAERREAMELEKFYDGERAKVQQFLRAKAPYSHGM